MDKQEAARKLQELLGNSNTIGVMHSVVVELSKYIIIFLFAVYTWHCFTVFIGRDKERKERVYRHQLKLMFTIHFICSLVLFLNSLHVQILFCICCRLFCLCLREKRIRMYMKECQRSF